MCQWGTNRNHGRSIEWAHSRPPRNPNWGVANRRPHIWAHRVGSLSGLITIVVMTLYKIAALFAHTCYTDVHITYINSYNNEVTKYETTGCWQLWKYHSIIAKIPKKFGLSAFHLCTLWDVPLDYMSFRHTAYYRQLLYTSGIRINSHSIHQDTFEIGLSLKNKVITTMVIRPLDNPTWCAQSVVADFQPLSFGYMGSGMG